MRIAATPPPWSPPPLRRRERRPADELVRGLDGLLGQPPLLRTRSRPTAPSSSARLRRRPDCPARPAAGPTRPRRLSDPLADRRWPCGHRRGRKHRYRRALRRVPFAAPAADAAAARTARHARNPAPATARARPLGQPRPSRGARLRRRIALGLAHAAGLPGSALYRLCPRQRLDRHQRQRAQQRQRPG